MNIDSTHKVPYKWIPAWQLEPGQIIVFEANGPMRLTDLELCQVTGEIILYIAKWGPFAVPSDTEVKVQV